MAPRKRNPENLGLPKRWCLKHGAYYFQVPKAVRQHWDGKAFFRLGSTLADAHATFAARLKESERDGVVRTVGDLLDKYTLRVLPTLAVTNQRASQSHMKALRRVFQEVQLVDLEPQDCYRYVEHRTAKQSAKHEISLLKSACQYAIQWGDLKAHPIKDVRIKAEGGKRDRYVSDDEIRALLDHTDSSQFGTAVCQAYIRLKLLTGIRKADMLRLTQDNLTEQGIQISQGKTGKGIIFEWTEALHEAVDQALKARPNKVTNLLFCTRTGEPCITADGRTGQFDSLWKDFISRVRDSLAKNGKTLEHFTEHDLRGKVGSDAESDERAAQLLDHSTTSVTRRHYRRRLKVVKPAA